MSTPGASGSGSNRYETPGAKDMPPSDNLRQDANKDQDMLEDKPIQSQTMGAGEDFTKAATELQD